MEWGVNDMFDFTDLQELFNLDERTHYQGATLTADPCVEAAEIDPTLRVVYPEPDQLQIDVDTPDQLATMNEMVEMFEDNGIEVKVEKYTKSRTPGHRHYYLRWPTMMSDWQRIALQAIFGSDPKREALSAMRLRIGAQYPAVRFFEKPEEEKKAA